MDEEVLPMIPPGKAVNDMIITKFALSPLSKDDGRTD
jgi:hypothetical protein